MKLLPRMTIESPTRHRTRLFAQCVLPLLFVLAGCSAPEGESTGDSPSADPAPDAEFVVSAGDSTFWVRSDDQGVSMRGSPLLLARAEGRFYELYVTDDDRSFQDAVFVGQRLWRRDVLTNDSSLVFADSTIAELARRWAMENPGDVPLGPDEPESAEPVSTASGEVAVLDVVGPFVSYEWFADMHPLGDIATHRLHRGVRDLRTGRAVRLAALVGDSAAASLLKQGERAFRSTADSLRTEGVIPAEFAFDPSSFALSVEAGRPVIAFLAPARAGNTGDIGGLPLPALPVQPLGWWEQARVERSVSSHSGEEERWPSRGGVEIVARYGAGGDVSLALRDSNDTTHRSGRAAGEATRPERREWAIGQLTPPVQRVYWLDRPPVASEIRSALDRAFDDADRYELEIPFTPLPRPRFAARRREAESLRNVVRLASLP